VGVVGRQADQDSGRGSIFNGAIAVQHIDGVQQSRCSCRAIQQCGLLLDGQAQPLSACASNYWTAAAL
jgi:hypothetical protein